MFARQTTARQLRERAAAFYDTLVVQARNPTFYQAFGVADTVDGRFDLIVLHAVLLFNRLLGEGEAGRVLQQAVFDYFFADMDRSLREMGTSDLAVPRRVKVMAQSFYGRMGAYQPAIAAGDRALLAHAIERNLFPGMVRANESGALADYALATAAALSGQPVGSVPLTYPDPIAWVQETRR